MLDKSVAHSASSGKGKGGPFKSSGIGIPKRRLWLLRILIMILGPSLVLGGLELGLRLFGWGYPTSFFLRTEIQGQKYYVTNDRFAWRFFPPALARTPVLLRMAAKKPAGTYRIFLFGESAAYGDPNPAFGAGRYLQTLLRERFPGTDFEVICTAMTAINSHAILPIARECARREGDLWIIYMGNNEMVGPFGASTVFGSRVPPVGLARANLAVKTTRTGQLLESLIGWVQRWGGRSPMPTVWTGLNMFKEHPLNYDDPNRLRAYHSFKQNLEDILRAAREAGVPVILSTVGSNLKDCAPFASSHSATLQETQAREWDAFFKDGIALEAAGSYEKALKQFAQAAALDPRHAELQFRMGHCDLALTNAAQALREFELARDDDALAFRADARINRIIRDAAEGRAGEGVYLLDAAAMLAQNSAGQIPGNDLFYDHVHLNFAGNYLLGRAFAEQTAKRRRRPFAEGDGNEWASSSVCDRRLGISPWDRYRVWLHNYSRVAQPPFTDQLNSAQRLVFYSSALNELKLQLNEESREQSLTMYREALALVPGDYSLRDNFAEFLSDVGDIAEAVKQLRQVGEALPQTPLVPYKIGLRLVRQGNIREAEESFSRALKIRQDYALAWNELGLIRANQRETAAAERCFSQALRIDPGFLETYVAWGFMEQCEGKMDQALKRYHQAADLLPSGPAAAFYQGVVLARQRRREEAANFFRAAVWMNPGFWQASYLLGMELAAADKIQEAQAQFSEVVRFRPDFPRAHLNYGVALAKQGKLEPALKEFEVTLQLNPTNASARQYLEAARAQLQMLQRRAR